MLSKRAGGNEGEEKGSCTDYWKKGASFSRVRMGYQTPTWWQHCDLQSFSPPVSSHSLAPMFSHLREGIHWLEAGMKLLQHQSFVRIRTTSLFYMLYSVATISPPLHLNNHFCHYYISKRESLPIFFEWHDGDGLSIGRFIKACNSHATSLSLLHGSNLFPSGQSTRRVALHFHFTNVWSIKAWHGAVGQCSHLKQDHCCDFPERGLALMGFCNFCAPQIPSMSCFLLLKIPSI